MKLLSRSCLLAFLVILVNALLVAQMQSIDHFDNVAAWKPIPSDGVRMAIKTVPGIKGKAMAVDFEFHGGSGYAIAQRDLAMTLPANYKFSFYLRGETPPNNFEFKLLDSLGNVWWIKRLNIDYPTEWKKTALKRRHLSFAWGPSSGTPMRRIAKIEFVVSAGSGGKGSFFIDELTFEPMADTVKTGVPPRVTASSSAAGSSPRFAADGNQETTWKSGGQGKTQWLQISFDQIREMGGLVLDWDSGAHATAYQVRLSDDGKEWTSAYSVTTGNGGRDYINLSETEARYVRLVLTRPVDRNGYALREVRLKDPDFSADGNAFFSSLAADAPQGIFPRYFLKRQSFWTVAGSSGDTKEALINVDGQIEVDKSSFSLEPFLLVNGRLLTWNDTPHEQNLDRHYLPIPTVRWLGEDAALSVRALVTGESGASTLIATYAVANRRSSTLHGTLYVALRPFQVNPPWQGLSLYGGTARIRTIDYQAGVATVNGTKRVVALSAPAGFGAAEFDAGDITEYLRKGALPASVKIDDHTGYGSASYAFDFSLEPGDSTLFHLAVPFHEASASFHTGMSREAADTFVANHLAATQEFWASHLDRLRISLPPAGEDVLRTVRSNLAYILINRDGPAIQPGSRSYERAWIRDGCLTSTALLQAGNMQEVREYLDWYAQYQYPSGKIPCVVDTRGSDPVPENDSHGEFIYAVRQYFQYSGDTTWLRGKLPQVRKTIDYIKQLRAERMTEEYRSGTPEQRACYGLLPESISHEGYSNKPMHSYWDDFFTLRGLKDAVVIAHALGEKDLESGYAALRDDFRTTLYASMRLAMRNKSVTYIPGCAELGDFDATSTAIGISPGGELGSIPEPELMNTFERYYEFFRDRRDGKLDWHDYTPYEVRLIGVFVQLGWRSRAHELLDFFMRDRRPPSFNHWAEVVWRDPSTPRFIGDMPHTWVGSDFIRSIRSMFVYERDADNALVIGAGIPEKWTEGEGVRADELPTAWGRINLTMRKVGPRVMVDLSGDAIPPGRLFVVKSPLDAPVAGVAGDGTPGPANEALVKKLPAHIEFSY